VADRQIGLGLLILHKAPQLMELTMPIRKSKYYQPWSGIISPKGLMLLETTKA
jgi:hypothetical protein